MDAETLAVAAVDVARLTPGDAARALVPKLKAMADEHRLELLLLLAERPHSVKELQEATGLGQTLVSHHLALLRQHQLVSASPRGRSNVYVLCCEELGEPVRVLAGLAALTPAGVDACCASDCTPAITTDGDPDADLGVRRLVED